MLAVSDHPPAPREPRLMLTQEDDIDAHALRRRGWSISAIARHLGRDRKTIRAYLSGERTAGVRAPAGADVFAPFASTARRGSKRTRTCGRPRCSTRSPRWATTGPTRGSRTTCGSAGCARRASRATRRRAGRSRSSIIRRGGNPMGLGRSARPAGRVGRVRAAPRHLLVGALSHSGKWRGVLAESDRPTAPGRRPTPGRRPAWAG